MIKGFEFTEGTRTYICTVEQQKGADEAWWWFAVTGDAQRYAPFRAVSDDTRGSVQKRVLAFYNNRLFQLTQPIQRGSHWGKRPEPTTAAAQAAQAAKAAVPSLKASANGAAKPVKVAAKPTPKPAARTKAKAAPKSASRKPATASRKVAARKS